MLWCRHRTIICSDQTWLMQEQTVYTRNTRNSRMYPCQKRNLTVRTHPKLVLKRLLASLVTGNMGLSVCATSTVGSLTCRHFYWWKRHTRSIRGKMTEVENLREKHRRHAVRIERKGIERRKEMKRRKGKIIYRCWSHGSWWNVPLQDREHQQLMIPSNDINI